MGFCGLRPQVNAKTRTLRKANDYGISDLAIESTKGALSILDNLPGPAPAIGAALGFIIRSTEVYMIPIPPLPPDVHHNLSLTTYISQTLRANKEDKIYIRERVKELAREVKEAYTSLSTAQARCGTNGISSLQL